MIMTNHILRSFDDELKYLRTKVSQMGGMAEEQLANAVAALKQGNEEQANAVIKADRALDQMEREIEKASMELFARRAPLADDLREVVAALKMTTLIERMGDHSKNIAKRSKEIRYGSAVEFPKIIDNMALEAQHMISNVMDAYARRDADAAMAVWEYDERLDALHSAASRDVISRMMEFPDTLNMMTHFLMISKNLERIGDQATNIAELVYYAITGQDLEINRTTPGTVAQP